MDVFVVTCDTTGVTGGTRLLCKILAVPDGVGSGRWLPKSGTL